MRVAVTGLVAGLAVLAAALPSQARLWKPTPAQLAGDYTTISHNKGEGGRVMISWVAAPIMTGAILKQMMDKYVVLSIVHTRTGTGGVTSWDDVQGVTVTDGNNQPLKEVPAADMPPMLVGFTASADAVVRQNTQGKAKNHWAIYEAGSLKACEKGKLLVTYDGETYSFDTPIPGCEKN
jgi:hypothetical protein